jgi:hypothetical protein
MPPHSDDSVTKLTGVADVVVVQRKRSLVIKEDRCRALTASRVSSPSPPDQFVKKELCSTQSDSV